MGKFLKFLKLLVVRCDHVHVRCIHGDEIVSTVKGWDDPRFARVRCLDCGKPVYDQALPKICTVTNRSHSGWEK